MHNQPTLPESPEQEIEKLRRLLMGPDRRSAFRDIHSWVEALKAARELGPKEREGLRLLELMLNDDTLFGTNHPAASADVIAATSTLVALQATAAGMTVVEQRFAMAPPGPTRRTDWVMLQFEALVPRKHREGLLGDLYEDVRDWRREGVRESVVRFRLVVQLFWAQLPRLIALSGVTWLVAKVKSWLAV